MNLSNWMGQLDDNLKNVPVINLAIPGSHDSMSYTVSPTSDVAPDSDHVVQVLARFFGKPTRRIIYKWCVTQELTVSQQLNFGIRYFDLRISTRETDSELYFVHGLYGDEITTNLNAINEYLEAFSEEIVILDFQHFYNFTEENHKLLMELIKSTYGDKLCPLPWDITTVTLSWMIGHNYRVIVVYRHKSSENNDNLWPSVRWPTPWPETTSVEAMLQFLTKTMSHRPRNVGLVTQCVLTPDIKSNPGWFILVWGTILDEQRMLSQFWFVLRNPCGGLRDRCSVPCFDAVLPWLRQQRPGVHGVNVVIADFVDTDGEEFSKVVIGLNNLLLKS